MLYNKFYCNNKCQVKYKNREKIYNWLKGKDKGYTGNGMIRPFIRKYLIGVSNNRCNKCGWNWNTAQIDPKDMYVCHKCGENNKEFYFPSDDEDDSCNDSLSC